MAQDLSENMKRLEKLFESRLNQFEIKLQKATIGSASASPDLNVLASEFSDFKAFIWQALKSFKSQIDLLIIYQDWHEMAMRRKVLLIHDMPESDKGDLAEEVVLFIDDKLKLPEISKDKLHVCHRLGSLRNKIRPVLVPLSDYEDRRLIWENKTALKDSGVTISEFLTRLRIKNCWSSVGKIIVSLPDKSRRKI
ncbi:unnamed protein product [Chilo suppressalis]|uniref:Uncharacterized protein n=1 Tax=Chilo suppressalis TaxID=168631 RepID=A0ABN8AR43_CHISP|nr:unnamed protein product [Chilo suppressalis]